jgi:hypothetical protein
VNELHKPKPPIIRALLRKYFDGLSVSDICAKTGIDERVARACLKRMEDAYIDRWILGAHQRPPEAIWCVVDVPEDCPRPKRKT